MEREELFRHIKKVAYVISLILKRQSALQGDLDQIITLWKAGKRTPYTLGGMIRLNHEIMFLCIDTYSLHKGMEMKKSLYSKLLEQEGRELSKVDKSPIDKSMIFDLGVIVNDAGNITLTDLNAHKKYIDLTNKEMVKSRKELQEKEGIISKNKEDIKAWWERVKPRPETIKVLSKKRDDYAHRLDSLDNIEGEIMPSQKIFIEMQESLSCVREVLTSYDKVLKNILTYTLSIEVLGAKLVYTSLSCPRCRYDEELQSEN